MTQEYQDSVYTNAKKFVINLKRNAADTKPETPLSDYKFYFATEKQKNELVILFHDCLMLHCHDENDYPETNGQFLWDVYIEILKQINVGLVSENLEPSKNSAYKEGVIYLVAYNPHLPSGL
jgi:hypothetical protein